MKYYNGSRYRSDVPKYWVVYPNYITREIMTVGFHEREHARIVTKAARAFGFWRIKEVKS